MAALKALYESLGFTGVATYIQSGNVVFKSNKSDPRAVGADIARSIEKKFGFTVTVIIRDPKSMASIIKKNPFVGRRGLDEKRLHVTFLQEKPAPALVRTLAPLTSKTNDEYEVKGTEIYLHCPNGYGTTFLSNTFFEKNLKVAATTRNWNTVEVLCGMASGDS